MAKATQSKNQNKTNTSLFPVPEKYRDLALILTLAVSIIVFLAPAIFSAGGFASSDALASDSFLEYVRESTKSGEFPLWNPLIFSGLPGYGSLLVTGDRWWDFTSKIIFGMGHVLGALFANDTARIAFWYMVYSTGMYLLMRTKGHQRFVAFFTAFAAVFSTWIMTWVMIGHLTKPVAIATFPFILMSLEKLRERFSLLYTVGLILALHVLLESTHVQMAYYGACAFGIYLIFELVSRLVTRNEPFTIFRPALLLALCAGLAFSMSADRFLSTLEYKPYSTRGSAPIEQTGGAKQDTGGGFDYEYCTNWSFSPPEMITFLVPNYYGFGKLEYKQPGEKKGRVMQTYWGQMPFTDAANYMGIGVLALAIIGIITYRRDAFIWALVAISIFALLLSFGKNFPVLFDLMFYNAPMFNNFRAPMMALMLMQFAVPILAGFGLTSFLTWRSKDPDQAKKFAMAIMIAAGAFLVFGFLYTSVAKSSYIEAVEASKKIPEGLGEFIYDQMRSDWLVTAFIGVLFGGALLLLGRNNVKRDLVFLALAGLLVVDLWRVAYRPMEIQEGKLTETEFREPPFIADYIKKDQSLYRVADLVYLTLGKTNVPAHFLIQNVHGYHSAKMRVYQDLLDVAGGQGSGGSAILNPFLWNLMNVKYVSSPQPLFQGVPPDFEGTVEMDGQMVPTLVYQNRQVLPRAFFVDSVEVAKPMDILLHLKNGDFNPTQKAYVEQAIANRIDTVGESARVKITDFRNHYIGADVEATGNNLLFFSEIYYPVSWRAYVDGQEVPVYKTNYAFRSIIVPPGKHRVEWKFNSTVFETGKNLSLGLNVASVALLGLAVFIEIRRKPKGSQKDGEAEAEFQDS